MMKPPPRLPLGSFAEHFIEKWGLQNASQRIQTLHKATGKGVSLERKVRSSSKRSFEGWISVHPMK